ncbi:MAG: cysteine desulfurase family protein [Bacillota bacterium]|uniref:cysteine desulfurase n=1 Tax=Virgibacillus salarius TaxID=447199 RepID=A0A941DY40_9BACI|nr:MULTISPECIES: cysteine desulfurase family protein [Bacillaceae]NAZ10241.1 aminotransferase class V-fold PLP-dependent enzyme [Agaribacter marinus]MBR7797531.1 cysteine desulfurase [Virgibacillus salarius]MCC2250264.1 cysteine desulfurase [Virgibacillus sp. AGTR]MDY7044629.1 cysteine desulfurase family protein [Virgibacillus sp. M23]QRZ17523.1 cysteine desulfurase [Virgibacillus sp. AGTR]
MEQIYLDHAATTPIHQDVLDTMYNVEKEVFGNPSSVHSFGRKARHLLDEARLVMARSIQAKEREIVFTSGGTEADNLALIGAALGNRDKGNHIITTVQEHHAVLHTIEKLEAEGFSVTYLPVDQDGLVSTEDVRRALTDETILVSIMFVNNETGVIQPIQEIGQLLHEHQAYFHTDAVQAYGLIDIDVNLLGIDLLTVSSHKINGPKGIGFLYVQENVQLQSLQFGGEQERKRRAGTENIAGIVGFQKAVELAMENKVERNELYSSYKNLFLRLLEENGVEFQVNGDVKSTIASIVNISFPGTKVEALLTNFDLEGIAASSGSACTAGSVEPSHVLTAMFGKEHECTTNSIRFSFGIFNTEENVEQAALRVAKIVKRLAR